MCQYGHVFCACDYIIYTVLGAKPGVANVTIGATVSPPACSRRGMVLVSATCLMSTYIANAMMTSEQDSQPTSCHIGTSKNTHLTSNAPYCGEAMSVKLTAGLGSVVFE